MNTVTRLRIAASAALLIVLATAQAVTAHAELVRARPADGATVPEGPVEIIARFNEPLDGRSSMQLRNAANEVVARGSVDGRELRIGLEGLLPGEYEVQWTAIGSDGHPERSDPGSWRFTVAAAAPPSPSVAPTASAPPSATTEPSVSPSAEPSAPPSPSASPAPEPGQSASGSDVLLPILIVLAIVIAGLAALLMRGRRTA